MEPPIEINYSDVGGWAVVEIRGEVDVYTVPTIKQHMIERLADGLRRFVIDLRGVTFIDSMGLGVLVGALKRVQAVRGELKLVITDAHTKQLFALTGLRHVFPIYDSVYQARRTS
ncbi:anti-sigma B factor antagonist [Streptomyces sp. WAC 04229]|uniref:STAS domain-containing protein n=1 Tax=Streptomyces sp. WAC 04229 TaxID=2203206 RepID=UPI000F74589F|nr:STAS domain-containing protein [Streptomyces sp. WAC 04229]RSN59805.1 anti-sigma B factor antagonist [Streptomyces sp. WAC 04229]